jgi:hypothetical protein
VGKKGERRADEVGERMVPLGMPAVRGAPFPMSVSALRRVAIVVEEVDDVLS